MHAKYLTLLIIVWTFLWNEEKNKLNSINISLLTQTLHLCLVILEHWDTTSAASPTISGRWTTKEHPLMSTQQNFHFLTYWICQFKVHTTLSEVSPLVKTHFLINTTQWFNVRMLEHYMALNHMAWGAHPWRTWNYFVHAFLYFCITKETWNWAPQVRNLRGTNLEHHSLIFLQGLNTSLHKKLNFTMMSPNSK